MLLLGLFAGLAVLLSAIGIYGVISYAVADRTHEIGVRMVLGARPTDVLRMVMKGGFWLTLAGILLGSIAAYWLTRVLSSHLYEVKPNDPLTFVCVAIVLMGVAMVACYLPARRAASQDPMAALRCE
jgi:putative ABC transport system permease protein